VPYSSVQDELEKEYGPVQEDEREVAITPDLLQALPAGQDADAVTVAMADESVPALALLALRGNTGRGLGVPAVPTSTLPGGTTHVTLTGRTYKGIPIVRYESPAVWGRTLMRGGMTITQYGSWRVPPVDINWTTIGPPWMISPDRVPSVSISDRLTPLGMELIRIHEMDHWWRHTGTVNVDPDTVDPRTGKVKVISIRMPETYVDLELIRKVPELGPAMRHGLTREQEEFRANLAEINSRIFRTAPGSALVTRSGVTMEQYRRRKIDLVQQLGFQSYHQATGRLFIVDNGYYSVKEGRYIRLPGPPPPGKVMMELKTAYSVRPQDFTGVSPLYALQYQTMLTMRSLGLHPVYSAQGLSWQWQQLPKLPRALQSTGSLPLPKPLTLPKPLPPPGARRSVSSH